MFFGFWFFFSGLGFGSFSHKLHPLVLLHVLRFLVFFQWVGLREFFSLGSSLNRQLLMLTSPPRASTTSNLVEGSREHIVVTLLALVTSWPLRRRASIPLKLEGEFSEPVGLVGRLRRDCPGKLRSDAWRAHAEPGKAEESEACA